MSDLVTRDHFTMQELADLMGQNMQVVNAVATQVKNISDRVDKGFVEVRSSINDIQKDIVDIKENEEITYSQQQNIQTAVHSRVYQLLNVPICKSDRTVADRVEIEKYGMLFHSRCYREVSNMGHLRQPYRCTHKKDYDAALADIEAWYPRGGVQGLKDEANKDAIAKKIAQEQGYK